MTLEGTGFIFPLLIVVALFAILRWLERSLHQRIFKVGWLLSKNSQTTTILYYTFFLPGVALHELVLWLVAGFLDVRAERAIAWPQKQEIGELKLDFVRLSKKAGRIKVAIISAAPPLVGIALIYWIATSVFNVSTVVNTMGTGMLTDVVRAVNQLVSTPDAWLWFYLMFAISNTMMPTDFSKLRGWWVILGGALAIIAVLYVAGIGAQLFANSLATPLTNGLNLLSGVFVVIIVIDLVMAGLLAIVENAYEYITGDSATFKDGKMIGIRRSELQAQRQQELDKARQRATRRPALAATAGGPPSIYKLTLPIPGAPGKEGVTQLPAAIVAPEERPTLSPIGDSRAPTLITGTARPSLPISRPSEEQTAVKRPLLSPASTQGETNNDVDDEEAEKPAASLSRPSPFAPLRPASPSGKPKTGRRTPLPSLPRASETHDDEQEETDQPAAPARRSSGFTPLRFGSSVAKPEREQRSPLDDENVDLDAEEEAASKPTSPSPRPSLFSPLKPASPSGKPPTVTRPTPHPGGQPDDLDDEAEETDKPATPAARTNPFAPVRGGSPATSGNQPPKRPTLSPAPPPGGKQSEAGEGEKPLGKPAPTRSAFQPVRPVAPSKKSGEEDDEDEAQPNRPATPRGFKPMPSSRPGGFQPITPRSPLAKPQVGDEEDDVSYEDDEPYDEDDDLM